MEAADREGLDALAERARSRLTVGDGPGALSLFTELLQQDTRRADGFLGAGVALELMGDDPAAEASYRHALSLDPGLADAHGALAGLAARRRQWDAIGPDAARALSLDPGQPTAAIALAQRALHQRQAAGALEHLAPVLAEDRTSPLQRAHALRLCGEALDILDRRPEAFAHFAASAAIFRAHHARACSGPEPLAGLDLARGLVERYAAAEPQLWRPAPGEAACPAAGHVFVLGFPRSGTTLLEQALAGHPSVVALEERPTLAPAIDAFLDPPTGIDRLVALDAAEADHWRALYWERVRSFTGLEPGQVFVDKQPFYGLWAPLIARLFPEAKVVAARRDPRDVVFSCFRNPFRMTPVTYELQDLERGARLYGCAMQALALFQAHAANPVFAYRHEDLVDDFEGVARPLCGFLGLDWAEAVAAFSVTAAGRDIRTPSADQVRRGLNRDGVGAWRRYADQLSPVLPLLEPFARRFGYAPTADLNRS